MRRFKKIDLIIQLTILSASLIVLFIEINLFIEIYFLGFLAWNIFSIAIHLFFFRLPLAKFNFRRYVILTHTLIIIGYPIILFGVWEGIGEYLSVYILYTFIMPFYYLWMSYRELQLLDEIHEQVTLLDIGQH